MSASSTPDRGGRLTQSIGSLVDLLCNDWAPLLKSWRDSPQGHGLIRHIDNRLAAGAVVYPPDVFRALEITPLSETRILILGQDPYHGPGQAEGLAFSVAELQRHPPSLRNIFKELKRDLGHDAPQSGSLLPWARRGALLLNTALTVEDGQPASHSKLGWEVLTDKIIAAVAQDKRSKVFLLWGAHAQSKQPLVAALGARHHVLRCNHPSPLSALRGPRPFSGCAHFSQASAFLQAAGASQEGFDWRLPMATSRVGLDPAVRQTVL